MKVINSKLAAIGLAAFVFASCSDSSSDNGGTNPAITPADLTSITLEENNANLLDRVVTYKNSTANARKLFSRAGETNFINAMPTDIPEEKGLNVTNPQDLEAGKSYVIMGDVDLTGYKMQGATIFVHTGKTLKYDKSAGGNTIIVNGSAHLEYTGTGNMIEEGDVVYFTSPKNVISAKNDLNINGTVYADLRGTTTAGKALATGLGAIKEADETGKNITPTQKVTFGSKAQVYVNGSIRATELNIEDGANVHTTANVFDAAGTANIKGNLKVDGFLLASTLNVDGNLVAGEKSAIKVTGTMNANAGSKIVADYINVTNNPKDAQGNQQTDKDGKTIPGDATLNLKGNCEITINNKSVINVNNLVTDNANDKGQIKLTENDAVAVIKADNFTNNGAERINTFATTGDNAVFLMEFTKSNNGSTALASFEDLDIAASNLDYDKATNGKGVEYKDEANHQYGYEWAGDPAEIAKNPKLDLVAAVASPSENLSATCIQKYGNNLYVSYHTNGDAVSSGDVEVAQISGKEVKIIQSVKTSSTDTDFNHLIVNGGHVYVVGNIRKTNKDTGVNGVGAFLGDFTLASDGKYETKLNINAIDKNVQKVDANCVAKYGDNLVVATSNGYEVFNKNFNHFSVATGANAKHVVAANNNLYAVDLTSGGQLKTFTSTDMENPATQNIGEITPTNGKNTIFVDGTDVYVCKGANGLVKIDAAGNQTQVYDCPTITAGDKAGQVKGNCNGVAVDSKYIYIACGSYGLVVLDKATGKELCHRRANWGNSANYVTLDGDNICVAYGKSRIQVFKVTSTAN